MIQQQYSKNETKNAFPQGGAPKKLIKKNVPFPFPFTSNVLSSITTGGLGQGCKRSRHSSDALEKQQQH
jgi:hypothetical protein